MARVKTKIGEPPKKYEELATWFLPRLIKDRVDHQNMIGAIEQLADLPRPTKDQLDYLDLLVTLVQTYEREHFAIDTTKLDPIETLKFLMEANEMNASDLGRMLGVRQLGAAILRRERGLSKAHITKLAHRFRVSPALFLKAC